MEHQSANRIACVERRSNAGEGHVVLLEFGKEASKCRNGCGQPANLFDDHAVDFLGFDVGQELLELWSFERSTGSAVFVAIGDDPAFVLLASDKGLRRVTLLQ